jgi:aspartyl-tRNA(Asn)/glutamyl-tRNA(Gln) amidotransferase subunit B
LQLLLRYLGVSDADMEKGQMRIEANVSLGQIDKDDNLIFGTKVEIKNLNSFRSVEKAINYEIERQKELLKKGEEIIQETRGWNEVKGITVSQRSKEEAHDYRYFPEPDLPPLTFKSEFIKELKSELPELPWEKRSRLKAEYYLDFKEADLLVRNKDLGEYFEKITSEIDNWMKVEKIDIKKRAEVFKIAKNYLLTDLLGLCQGRFLEEKCLITPENFAEFAILIFQNNYPSKLAKTILSKMFETGKDPSLIIEEEKLGVIDDEKAIIKVVREVIEENPKAVEDFKGGKTNALQFLIGQVMNKTQGRLTPDLARKFLEDLL